MDRFNHWSNDIALTIEPSLRDEQIRRVECASKELYEYFEDIIEERRLKPQDDMITALLNAEDEGDRLTHEETAEYTPAAACCRQRNYAQSPRQRNACPC